MCDAVCDRDALIAFYEATNGEEWFTDTNWGSAEAIDSWHGVETNADGRVVGLRLPHNGLSGQLPARLADLTELVALDLSYSDFTGGLPEEVGGLRALERLRCGACGLSGEIPPSIGDLRQLAVLELAVNRLHGKIPTELGGLANLRELYLGGQRLFRGDSARTGVTGWP